MILTRAVKMGGPWVQFIARDNSWHSGWLVGGWVGGNILRIWAKHVAPWSWVAAAGGEWEGPVVQLLEKWEPGAAKCENCPVGQQDLQALHFWGPPTVRHLLKRVWLSFCHFLLLLFWHSVVEVKVESGDEHVEVLILVEVVLAKRRGNCNICCCSTCGRQIGMTPSLKSRRPSSLRSARSEFVKLSGCSDI